MAKRIHIVAQENNRGSVAVLNVLNESSVISSSRWCYFPEDIYTGQTRPVGV